MTMQILNWLSEQQHKGPFSNEDALHAVLPLFEQVAETHEKGQVAPLCGLEHIEQSGDQLYFANQRAQKPQYERLAIRRIDEENRSGIEIHGEYRIDETDHANDGDLAVHQPGEEITKPAYLIGWVTWEHEVGHHDALTDILSCGMILAALVSGLDFNDLSELKRFAENRHYLAVFNDKLHPVIARIIMGMTELSRHKRLQNLPTIIDSLRNYRRQALSSSDSELVSNEAQLNSNKRGLILGKLKERLFDISRRNRLLYFKSTLGMVGMTEASIPLRMDPKRIDPNSLFIWSGKTAKTLASGKPMPLGEILRFEDAPYLPGVLDRLRSEDRKNRTEVGFSMLRLAVLFLRWHNLKDQAEERIHSPLLLLSVKLEKKKGVRDAYVLTALDEELEVNPILRHHLEQLYGLKLPDRIPLDSFDLEAFHRELTRKFTAQSQVFTST